MHFSKNASWINNAFNGKILDNSTFDQTAVLYAVRGKENIWSLVKNGKCIADNVGGNLWQTVDGKTNHAYLKLEEEPEKVAEYIEALMLHAEN